MWCLWSGSHGGRSLLGKSMGHVWPDNTQIVFGYRKQSVLASELVGLVN